MGRGGSRKDASRRRLRAADAIGHLSDVLTENVHSDIDVADIAARDILRTSKRHGSRPDTSISTLICRSCEAALVPGRNARVRIKNGYRITTCLTCGGVRRRCMSTGEVE